MHPFNKLMTHLYTAAEYAALGETEQRTELQEGTIVLLPGSPLDHALAAQELVIQLRNQTPADLVAVFGVDIDLELVPPDDPGTVRRPDLVVVDGEAFGRVGQHGGILRASDVRLIAEVALPGARRTDYFVKRSEYAAAGIPHYWIVNVEEPVSLLVCELAEKGDYVDSGEVTGVFATDVPFHCRVDLPSLLNL